MKRDIQLFIFNSFIGNPEGFKLITKQLGWAQGLRILLKMQLNSLFNNPFHSLNRESELLSWKERLSQKQILPAFALYDALIKNDYTIAESIALVEVVVVGVANKFLKFTVPIVNSKDIESTSSAERKNFFSEIVDRFPNAFGTLNVEGNESFHFHVNTCLFASYCKKLGYEHLAPIFCKADKLFFDQQQPLIQFSRTETLAEQGSQCDFGFKLIAKG